MANYYVKPDGDDGDDGTTFALAKATLNAVYALCSAGDTVYVCSSEASPFVDILLELSGADNVTFIGTSPTDGAPYTGNTRATISVTGASNIITAINDNNSCKFHNIQLLGVSTSIGYICYQQATVIGNIFINCEFKGLQIGIYTYKVGSIASSDVHAYNCIFNQCTYGIYIYDLGSNYAASGICNVFNCIFKGCSYGICRDAPYLTAGIYACQNMLNIQSCRFIDNSVGIRNIGSGTIDILNSVFYLNSSHGISLNAVYAYFNLVNSIFHSNGGYAISSDVTSGFGSFHGYCDYNCYYNNTTGIVNANINGGTTPGSHNILTNPLFASTTLGSEDFRLQEESPCLGTGIGYTSGQ
jgi:hypothetical protein